MFDGEYLCYGQFDRDFINFLRRQKSEQYEELDVIIARARLKVTVSEIEHIIEASRVYSVPNETVLQELSELKEKQIVTKTISSGVFSHEYEKVIVGSKVKAVESVSEVKVTESSRSDEEQTTVEKQSEQPPPQEDKGIQVTETLLEEENAQSHLDTEVCSQEESSQALETDEAEEPRRRDDIAKEAAWKWDELYEELVDCKAEGKVSLLTNDFKRDLTSFMLNPPDRSTQPPLTELKIKSDRQLGRCYLDIGDAEVERGNLQKANIAYSEALKIGCGQDDKELQWKAYDGLGTAASLNKDYETSTKHFNAAVYLLDRELSTYENTSLRNHIMNKMERKV